VVTAGASACLVSVTSLDTIGCDETATGPAANAANCLTGSTLSSTAAAADLLWM